MYFMNFLLLFLLLIKCGNAEEGSSTERTPVGFEEFETLEFYDELDDTFTPIKPKAEWNISEDRPGGFYKPGTDSFGTHLCTMRPCNCFIGDCYAYCAWNWCYERQSVEATRTYLPCTDELTNPWDCKDFDYPCLKYC